MRKHIFKWLFLISGWWEDSGKYLIIIISCIVFAFIIKCCSIYYGSQFDYYFRVVIFYCFIIAVGFRIVGGFILFLIKEPKSSGKLSDVPKWTKKTQVNGFVSKVEVKKLTDDFIEGEF